MLHVPGVTLRRSSHTHHILQGEGGKGDEREGSRREGGEQRGEGREGSRREGGGKRGGREAVGREGSRGDGGEEEKEGEMVYHSTPHFSRIKTIDYIPLG